MWETAGHFVSILKKQKVDRNEVRLGKLKLTSSYPLPSVKLCLLATAFQRAPIPKLSSSIQAYKPIFAFHI